MELTVVGAHGTWPSAGGATSGFLVRHDGYTLLLDMGSGTVGKLQEHVGLFDIDAVLISHSHPDHVVDLYTYLFARLFSPEEPPRIPLFVAPKVVDRMSPLLADDSGDMKLAQGFDVHPIEAGDRVDAGPFRIQALAMAHSVPTVGVRVEAGGSALAYSADTGPTEELMPLAREAGLLIADASWQDDGDDARPPIHMTAREAAETAARAGAETLVLAHLRPHLDRERSRHEASDAFDGNLEVAVEGLRMDVG
jgi:ribonuclease BN (tRNA processing enzyme)